MQHCSIMKLLTQYAERNSVDEKYNLKGCMNTRKMKNIDTIPKL